MARKTVANLRDSISGLLSGLNLNNVVNLNECLERTAREMAQVISIPEANARTAITLYDGVTEYTAPTDSYGSQFIELRPQGNSRNALDNSYHEPLARWDRDKNSFSNGNHLSFEYVKGVGRLRIVSSRPLPKVELDPMSDDANWAAAGSAGSLAEDETIYWEEPASLRFTLTGSSTGTLTKAISTVDLTDFKATGVAFLAMRTPSTSNLTSMTLRVGSDASNYYEVASVTTGFLGSWTTNDWLLTAFDFANKTTTGTPDDDSIDYVQLRIAHSGTITNFYVGGLWISLPSPHDLLYPVAAIFQASGSSPSQTITNNNDTVLLNDDALLIYEHLSAINVTQQQGGGQSSDQVALLNGKLYGTNNMIGLIPLYRSRNPSQVTPIVDSYY